MYYCNTERERESEVRNCVCVRVCVLGAVATGEEKKEKSKGESLRGVQAKEGRRE